MTIATVGLRLNDSRDSLFLHVGREAGEDPEPILDERTAQRAADIEVEGLGDLRRDRLTCGTQLCPLRFEGREMREHRAVKLIGAGLEHRRDARAQLAIKGGAHAFGVDGDLVHEVLQQRSREAAVDGIGDVHAFDGPGSLGEPGAVNAQRGHFADGAWN
jgi:hypothetical protein